VAGIEYTSAEAIGFVHLLPQLIQGTNYLSHWLGISIKLENFSDYEAITSMIKIKGGSFRLLGITYKKAIPLG